MYKVKQSLEGVPRKQVLLKFENIRGDELYINDGKNIQQLLRIRLLDFFIFHIKGNDMHVFQSLRAPNLRSNSFLLTGQGHIHSIRVHSIHDSMPETLFSQFTYPWCSCRNKFGRRWLFCIFCKNRGSDTLRIHFLVELHDELCLLACPNKI